MADLLIRAKSPVKKLTSGQRLEGIVVSKNKSSLILDIGAKSEGIVAEKAFSEARELISKLKVGDKVLTTVIFPETRDGSILLSLRDAVGQNKWRDIEKALKENTEIAVLGKSVSQSGISVDFEGLVGFIPASQIGKENSKNPENLIGKYFKVKLIEADKEKNKLVLSEKQVSDAEDIKLIKEASESITEGDIFDGLVTTVANFGVFVAINVNKVKLEGLVHVSELSWGKVFHPSDLFSVGDKVKISVLAVRDGKLALSIKHAGKDPWSTVGKKYKKEDKIQGKVVKNSDFGTFVEIEEGIEGLVHITKIPPGKKLEIGSEVNCYIEDIDTKNRKISLGLVLTSVPVGYK